MCFLVIVFCLLLPPLPPLFRLRLQSEWQRRWVAWWDVTCTAAHTKSARACCGGLRPLFGLRPVVAFARWWPSACGGLWCPFCAFVAFAPPWPSARWALPWPSVRVWPSTVFASVALSWPSVRGWPLTLFRPRGPPMTFGLRVALDCLPPMTLPSAFVWTRESAYRGERPCRTAHSSAGACFP